MRSTWVLSACVLSILAAAAGYYCYFYNQFWTHVRTDRMTSLCEYHSAYISGYRGRQVLVHQGFRVALDRLAEVAGSHDVKVVVTSSFRSPGSVASSDRIVEEAQHSNHWAGHAVDVNLKLGDRLYSSKELGRELATLPKPVRGFLEDVDRDRLLRWGGRFGDPVHIDDRRYKTSAEEWGRECRACEVDFLAAAPRWPLLHRWAAWTRAGGRSARGDLLRQPPPMVATSIRQARSQPSGEAANMRIRENGSKRVRRSWIGPMWANRSRTETFDSM